ncbi:hypothetical protein NMY22_g12651 [Coprinellus aureogranulatus]|nr:hypothetical protein NMY22_g12651 [Coprinellus aureogranulatus]
MSQSPDSAGSQPTPSHTAALVEALDPSTSRPAPPYFGLDRIASTCSRFIVHLFTSSQYPSATTAPQIRLPHFIAYVIYRTKLHESIAIVALLLLQRLKDRFPRSRSAEGHRLFLTAYVIASKVMHDETYSNKSWGNAVHNMYSARDIGRMEREFCTRVQWDLTVTGDMFNTFKSLVEHDFCQDRPFYPVYSNTLFSPGLANSRAPLDTTTAAHAADAQHAPPIYPLGGHSPERNTAYPEQDIWSAQAESTDTLSTAGHPLSTSPLGSPIGPSQENASPTPVFSVASSTVAALDHEEGAESLASSLEAAHSQHPLRGRVWAFATSSRF